MNFLVFQFIITIHETYSYNYYKGSSHSTVKWIRARKNILYEKFRIICKQWRLKRSWAALKLHIFLCCQQLCFRVVTIGNTNQHIQPFERKTLLHILFWSSSKFIALNKQQQKRGLWQSGDAVQRSLISLGSAAFLGVVKSVKRTEWEQL